MEQSNAFELVRELRDLTVERTQTELASLPGAHRSHGGYRGPGWQAELEELPAVAVGSMEFSRLRLTLKGEEQAVTDAWDQLWLKFLRGGA